MLPSMAKIILPFILTFDDDLGNLYFLQDLISRDIWLGFRRASQYQLLVVFVLNFMCTYSPREVMFNLNVHIWVSVTIAVLVNIDIREK